MNKLQRNIDGQIIEFVSLPRIFTSLAQDLPSGSIKLGNGEVAYYRIHRNLKELKHKRKEIKQLVDKLVGALKSIIESDQFASHYGVKNSPRLDSGNHTAIAIRTILLQNLQTVEYKSTNYGRGRPIVEHITVPLGNMAFFNAVRGMRKFEPTNGEIVGKFYLNADDKEDAAFDFWVKSPFIDLSNHIGPDGLAEEILAKIRGSLYRMVDDPRIEFEPNQFEGFRKIGLEDLATRPTHKGKNKPQGNKSDETEHLMESEANAERLTSSVETINRALEVPAEEFVSVHKEGDLLVAETTNAEAAEARDDAYAATAATRPEDSDYSKVENMIPVIAAAEEIHVGDTMQYQDEDGMSHTAVVEIVQEDKKTICAKREDGKLVVFILEAGLYSMPEGQNALNAQ